MRGKVALHDQAKLHERPCSNVSEHPVTRANGHRESAARQLLYELPLGLVKVNVIGLLLAL
jgi:hypothetical protein